MRWRNIYSAALVLWLSMPDPAAAEEVETRAVSVEWAGGTPRISFSAKDLADKNVRRALASGIRRRMVVSVEARPDGQKNPIVARSFQCSVTFDLWEENYQVTLGARTTSVASIDAAIRRCLVVSKIVVGKPSHYVAHKGEPVHFFVRAEFNPISERRCRALVRGDHGDAIGPIVVNIVRRRICAADRSIEFRSAGFQVP